MNKENEFYENEVSTGIQESWEKSTYSSRYYKSQKNKHVANKKVLPSRCEKAAIVIQRFWRFRQAMKRRVCEKVFQEMDTINECYELENKVLRKLVNQYQQILEYRQNLMKLEIKEELNEYQQLISESKKQCVITSFKLEKKKPKKELLSQLINKKQEQKELNLMLNREKLIVQEDLDEERKQYEMLLQEYKRLNVQHLELTREKNQLIHKNAQKLLQTSKFGSKNPTKRQQTLNNSSSHRGKTFIVDFFEEINFQ